MSAKNYSQFKEKKAVAPGKGKRPSTGLQVGSRGSFDIPQKQGYAKAHLPSTQPKRLAPGKKARIYANDEGL
jgi:hypothetical protein